MQLRWVFMGIKGYIPLGRVDSRQVGRVSGVLPYRARRAVMGFRHAISDSDWDRVKGLLPGQPGPPGATCPSAWGIGTPSGGGSIGGPRPAGSPPWPRPCVTRTWTC